MNFREKKFLENLINKYSKKNSFKDIKYPLIGDAFLTIDILKGIEVLLSGQLTKNAVLVEVMNYWYLLAAVLIGGQVGNFLNLKIFPTRILALVTAFLVLFVAIRMGFRIFF